MDVSNKRVRLDIRLRHFLWLWPLGVFFHSLLWVSRRGMLEYATEFGRQEWTPGMFLPFIPHLIVSWVLWLPVALYLAFGKHKRIAAGIFMILSLFHFQHLFIRVPNHFLLIVLPILLVFLFPYHSDDESRTPLLVRLLRALVTITYVFAVLHKLTPVYFTPEISPATALLRPLYANLGWPWFINVVNLAPLTGVLTEVALIYCLNTKRWRAVGIYLGLIFHGIIIAGTGAADYSAVILALYPVFLGKDESRRAVELLSSFSWWKLPVSFCFALIFALACFFPLTDIDFGHTNNSQSVYAFPFVVGLITLSAYAAIALLPWLRRKVELGWPPKDNWTKRENVYLGIFVVLYTLNCAAPYLGIKFYYSQAMFSGLAKDARNHYFIPRLPLFRNDDYLDVVSINIGGEVPEHLSLQLDSFRYVLMFKGKYYIHSNYLASITENACRYPELRPVSLVYRLPGSSYKRTFSDVCEQEDALPDSYPFNFYSPKMRKPRSRG